MRMRFGRWGFVLIAAMSSALAMAQPTFQWAGTMSGSSADGFDYAIGAKADAAGNVYVVANVYNGVFPNDFQDIQIRKYNALGVAQWTVTYNRAGFDDRAYAMDVSPSGDVYVAGMTSYDGTNSATDVLALRYNTSGAQVYAAIYVPTSNNEDEYGYACAVDGSGNLFIGGEAGNADTTPFTLDAAVFRVNSNGTWAWRIVVAGTNVAGTDYIDNISIAPNGDVVGAGVVADAPTATDVDALVVRYTPAGGAVTLHKYNSADGASQDAAFDVVADAGNIYACGVTGTALDTFGVPTQQKGWIRKISNANAVQFTTVYNGGATALTDFNNLIVNSGGTAYVVGSTSLTGAQGAFNIHVARYSNTGAQTNLVQYNGPNNDTDLGADLALDSTGNLIVCGTIDRDAGDPAANRDIVLNVYNGANLAQMSTVTYNNVGDWDVADTMTFNTDGSILIAGNTYVNLSDSNALVVRYTTVQRFVPVNFAVLAGIYAGGNTASLANSDNNKLFIICDELNVNGKMQAWTTSNVFSPSGVTIYVETSGARTDITQFTRVRNYVTNTYETVDVRSTTLSDTAFSVNLTGTLSRLVSGGGEMRIEIEWIPQSDLDAADGWSLTVDQTAWDVR